MFVCQIEGKEVEVTAPVIAPVPAAAPAAGARGGPSASFRPSAPPQRPGALHPARSALAPTQPKVVPPLPVGGEKKATPVRVAVTPPAAQAPKAAPAPAPPAVETMDVDDEDEDAAPHLAAAMQAPARRLVRSIYTLLLGLPTALLTTRSPQEVDEAADAKRPKLSTSVSAGGTASLSTAITPQAGPSVAIAPGGTAIKYGRLTHSSGGARTLPPARDLVVHADDDDDFV